MLRLLGTVARGGRQGVRNLPKPGGAPTTALFCICSLWNVGQTFSFATARTPQAMSSAVDVSVAYSSSILTKEHLVHGLFGYKVLGVCFEVLLLRTSSTLVRWCWLGNPGRF